MADLREDGIVDESAFDLDAGLAKSKNKASQVITTPKKDKIRVVRVSRHSMALIGEDLDDFSVLVNGEDADLTVLAKGFWGGLWDGIKSAAAAGAKLIGVGGCKPTTTTTVDVKNGQVTKITTTTTCT